MVRKFLWSLLDVDHNREQEWRKGATLSDATCDREWFGLLASEHDLLDVVLVQGLKSTNELQGCATAHMKKWLTLGKAALKSYSTIAGLKLSRDAVRERYSRSRTFAIMLRPFKSALWAAETEGAYIGPTASL